MGIEYATIEDGAKKAVNAVKKLAVDVKLPLFSSLSVNQSDFEMLAEMSVKNISTESNPRPMSKEDYMAVIENAFAGNL
ncbi:hypothetical protein SDC9_94312 [bioreactor metagenome]|uniref:Fe-containing alcohol dehydrogenase-like C-terminal domain-containing protein n=2 Tax=root TaxID=1 RepID=A0A645A5R6_9ZZZZ